MKNPSLFTLSEKGKSGEYTASIVRVHNLRPIEGSDFLVLAEAAGEDVVVRKDEVKEGDIMVYCRIETVLDASFLGANNLFDPSCYEMNKNAAEYERTLELEGKDEARKLCGYFNKHGRVRIARLRGCPSKGFLFDMSAFMKWRPELFDGVDLEEYLDIPCFDTIDGKQFIKVYIPFIPEYHGRSSRDRDKGLKRFDRILPEYFHFHYDTGQLTMLISEVRPNHNVAISVKLHGTSAIFGNILTKAPIQKSAVAKMFDKIRRKKVKVLHQEISRLKSPQARYVLGMRKDSILKKIQPNFTEIYAEIYASRNVIKNQYINRGAQGRSYYKTDVWKFYADLLKGKLDKGTTIYGEIVGYEEGSQRMIQKNYDYGCDPGTSKLMIYRVVNQPEDGPKTELDIIDVHKFTLGLMKKYPELKDRLHPIDILFHGSLVELYPDLNPRSETWNDDVLHRLKKEERFGMQEGNREPMCNKKVPREGIVVRIDGLPSFCAKLKTDDYFFLEAKSTDKGEVDMEMAQQG